MFDNTGAGVQWVGVSRENIEECPRNFREGNPAAFLFRSRMALVSTLHKIAGILADVLP